MNKTQCRLCLADIPHDYDHSLEVTLEKGEIEDDVEFKKLECPLISQSSWPDYNGLVAVVFLLLMANAAVLFTRLILLDILESCVNCERRRGLIVGIYIVTVVGVLGNLFVTVLARRKFNSNWITLYCVCYVGLWSGQLIRTIWDISIPAPVMKLD
jgi:hypothetical protein